MVARAMAAGDVPRWTRWFVRTFLAAFVVCGLVGIEAWPLTGWRLFSHLRYDRSVTWRALAVGPDGEERRVAFSQLGTSFEGSALVMSHVWELSSDQRGAACRAWLDAVGRSGTGRAVEIRIYRVERPLLPRVEGRPVGGLERTLAYTCRDGDGS